nr:hypothetical protein [Paraburkholderia sp. BL8N3]
MKPPGQRSLPPSAKPRIQRPFVLQVFAHSHQYALHLIAGAA